MKLAKYLKFVPVIGATGLLMASFFAVAQTIAPTVVPAPKPEIESTLTAKRVEIDADKKEKLLEAKSAKPGEVIEYQVTYTNKGKTPVRDLFATLPIPEPLSTYCAPPAAATESRGHEPPTQSAVILPMRTTSAQRTASFAISSPKVAGVACAGTMPCASKAWTTSG